MTRPYVERLISMCRVPVHADSWGSCSSSVLLGRGQGRHLVHDYSSARTCSISHTSFLSSSLSLNTKKISIHAPWWINLECVQFIFFERKWCEKVLRIKIRKITKRRDDFFFYINRNYSSFNDIYNSNELFKRFQLINI